MHFLMTTDVERFSVGLPRLLDLYARHDIKCTFYFTGMFVEQSPESVELVMGYGYEIGYHYEVLDKAKGELEKAIKIFEKELNGFRKICDVKTICMHVSNFIVAMS